MLAYSSCVITSIAITFNKTQNKTLFIKEEQQRSTHTVASNKNLHRKRSFFKRRISQ